MNKLLHYNAFAALLLSIHLLLAGCDSPPPAGGNSEMDRMAAALDKPKQEPAPEPQPEPAEPEPEPQFTAAEEITAKDAQSGRVFHDQGGYLNAVFSARFVAEHQMTLNKLKHALDLYKGANGHPPKSHEEFMQVIIVDNMIQLPELRDGFEYWYNAEEGELMMRKPVPPGTTPPTAPTGP